MLCYVMLCYVMSLMSLLKLVWDCRAVWCGVFGWIILSCPVLSCPVLSCPALPCPVLSCPVLSCPVLSCPVLSCPALPCPVLQWELANQSVASKDPTNWSDFELFKGLPLLKDISSFVLFNVITFLMTHAVSEAAPDGRTRVG
jgi:hypothetical protein